MSVCRKGIGMLVFALLQYLGVRRIRGVHAVAATS